MLKRGIAMMIASALLVLSLGGCAGFQQNDQEAKAQAANRQYMSQVSSITDELTQRLAAFDMAVADNDVVAMRLKADDAFKTIDQLSTLQPPDVLKDVQAGYVEGATKLKDALDSYVALYSEAQGTDDRAMTESAYAERLAAIQTTYDEGIAKLQETDKKATEL